MRVVGRLSYIEVAAATIYQFHKVDKWAPYLLVPYLAWIGIATALNASVYLLNG